MSYPEVGQEFNRQDHRIETVVEDMPTEKTEEQEIPSTPVSASVDPMFVPIPDPVSPLSASPVPLEKIPVPITPLSSVTETLIPAAPSIFVENRQTGPNAAFLPLIPPEMENDYWKELPYDSNQLL